MKYAVFLTPTAQVDLREIKVYISAFAPEAARQWSMEIRRQIKSLSRNPKRCPLAPEGDSFRDELRELIVGSRGNRGVYRVLFLVLESRVMVVHIRHGSRLSADFE